MDRVEFAQALNISIVDLNKLMKYESFPKGRKIKIDGIPRGHKVWLQQDIDAANEVLARLRRAGFFNNY